MKLTRTLALLTAMYTSSGIALVVRDVTLDCEVDVGNCVSGMLEQAGAIGCVDSSDLRCLCGSDNFAYGIRDCVAQGLGKPECVAPAASVTSKVCRDIPLSAALKEILGGL
ncbi:hypothetical protein TWF694_000650 [Orbilia ellipsospora]|uniref:CFEM domain-containing protein n=1 Tax=Orbilia ellipsospora TaxID=2528407 RepID=A0AAV9XP90_9PEZI